MKSLAFVLLWAAAATAANVPDAENHQPGFATAEARDTSYGAPISSSSDSYFTPVTSTSGSSYYTPVDSSPGFSAGLGTSFGQGGASAYAGGNLSPVGGGGVGLFGSDFLSTALNIVLALLGFSLLVQLVGKVLPLFDIDEILDTGRSLSSDDVATYTGMVMNGIEKFDKLNLVDYVAAVPK